MSSKKQAERFRFQVKSELLARNQTITALARKLGYARNTVSMAINRHIFPGVILNIRQELGLYENN
jgi:plasmid maintenance system antidote protein VapI